MVALWLAMVLAAWAAGAAVAALYFAREARRARREAERALMITQNAVQRLAEAEATRGGGLVVFGFGDGSEELTAPLRSARYWVN